MNTKETKKKFSQTGLCNWIVYRHIRIDKNVPFYIGIGKSSNRAYDKRNRSAFWKRIINKSDYLVEILFEGLSKSKAIDKEIEFINLYGRIDLKNGTLCNMTKGGEGTGVLNPLTEYNRVSKISKTLKGRKHKKETVIKNRLSHSNRWNIKINGKKYNSIRGAAEILNLNRNTIKYRILSNNFKDYERKEN